MRGSTLAEWIANKPEDGKIEGIVIIKDGSHLSWAMFDAGREYLALTHKEFNERLTLPATAACMEKLR